MPVTPVDIEIPDVRNVDVLSQSVWAKTEWDADWEEKTNVYAENVTFAASPSIGSAKLRYRYGRGRQNGDAAFAFYDEFTLPNLAYVQIRLVVNDIENDTTKTIYWYGVAGRIVNKRGGADAFTGEGEAKEYKPFGVQEIECVSLEWLLSAHQITHSWYRQSSSAITALESLVAYDFNPNGRPNRSVDDTIDHPDGSTLNQTTAVFAHDTETPEFWSTLDIVKYLLNYQTPNDYSTTYPMVWRLKSGSDAFLPDGDQPRIECEGHNTLSILKRLIPRQRGIGFFVTLSDDSTSPAQPPKVELNVFSFADATITLPDSSTIDENPDQINLTISGDRTNDVITYEDAFSRYHQILARGRKVCYCFHIPYDVDGDPVNSTGGRGWDSSLQAYYENGYYSASDLPTAADITKVEEYKRKFRDGQTFREVFRRYRLGNNWLGKPHGASEPYVITDPDDLTTKDQYSIRNLRVLPFLPMYVGLDYETASPTVPDGFDDSNLMEPFIFMEDWQKSEWVYGHQIQHTNDLESYDESASPNTLKYNVSIDLTPVDGEFAAIDVNVHGAPQLPDSHGWTKYNFFATVAVFGERYCEKYAFAADVSTVDQVLEKVIYFGDEYRLDIVAKGAVVRIEDNNIVQADASRIIRDDREKLETLAERALAWYGTDRQAITYTTSYLNSDIALGVLIKNLSEPAGDVELNTVVTQVEFNFPVSINSQPGVPKMTFQTNAAELDVY